MTLKEARKIREIWNDAEAVEPDISTERLFAMTIDQSESRMGYRITHDEICHSLELTESENETQTNETKT